MAEQGSEDIPSGSDPRQLMEDLLEFSLHLVADREMAKDCTPDPMICPLCLTPSNIIPLWMPAGPIWIETGHTGDCPVHTHREELALARRDRWRSQYSEGGVSVDFFKSILGGAGDRKRLDDWLRVATEFEASLPPRRRFSVSASRPQEPEFGSPLDQGILTPETRLGYGRIRKTLQDFAASRKPTQIPVRDGFLDEESGRDALRLVRSLPEPEKTTALEVKAVFHEIMCGSLEWAYYIEDRHFPMHEYAHIALGRRIGRFTPGELSQLAAMKWTQPMLLMKHNQTKSSEGTASP